jgi:hypothetical protein
MFVAAVTGVARSGTIAEVEILGNFFKGVSLLGIIFTLVVIFSFTCTRSIADRRRKAE